MPDIVIAGATFRQVSQIDIPKESSGTASYIYEEGTKSITQNGTGIDVSGYSTVDVDVQGGSPVVEALSVTQNGTYTAPSGVDGYSPVTVNVSGGGGASNIVTGTFKGTTAEVIDVNINYSGTGYPIALLIFPTGGARGNTSFDSLVQRYAIASYMFVKNYMNVAPNYNYQTATNEEVSSNVVSTYKNSTSDSSTYGRGGAYTAAPYDDREATNTVSSCVRVRSNKKMSVRIASSSYGFPLNIEYTYIVLYSA